MSEVQLTHKPEQKAAKKRTYRLEILRKDLEKYLGLITCSDYKIVIEFQCDAGTKPFIRPLKELE